MKTDDQGHCRRSVRNTTEARIPGARLRVVIVATLLAFGLGAAPLMRAQTLTTLHSFSGSDGSNPLSQSEGAALVSYNGNLYGTTRLGGSSSLGTVFELNSSSGKYIESVLHNFGGNLDGYYPVSGLIADSSGNLYGTTVDGGSVCYPDACGAVFELVNSSGTYTEKLLYSFTGVLAGSSSDGYSPYGGVIMDASGNLYGTTAGGGGTGGGGTVFELVNSSGTYTEQILYRFPPAGSTDGFEPIASLVMDSSGNLYGTTSAGGSHNYGIVFELVNSSGTYTEKILYNFAGGTTDGANPTSSLIMDSSANLYGTTGAGGSYNQGTVFELVNSSGTYTESVLYNFIGTASADGAAPSGSLLMDPSGNLYGTTVIGGEDNDGTLFKLSFNSPGSYTESVLYSFAGTDGSNPEAGLVMDSSGNLYGTTKSGGPFGDGTVFEFNPTSNSGSGSGSGSSGFAVLNGSNTFDGTQTVNGTLTATSLFGNGSGLTNLNPANLSAGTAAINITGNAATATSATTAATSTSALTATTAGSASTAGSLAATPTQCGTGSFATGIAANGNANCAASSSGIGATQILFSSAGIPVWSGAFMGISAPSLTETSVEQMVAVSGHITAMQCYSQVAPKGSSETFTLRQNGASAAAVCTIAAGATSGSVTGLSLLVSAGNLLDLKVGGPTTLGAATVAVAIGP